MSPWTERTLPADPPCPSKPVHTGLLIEFNAETLALAEGATVTTWADQSGNSNDATGVSNPKFENGGWGGIDPAANLSDFDSDQFSYDGTVFESTPYTFFIVAFIKDLTTPVGLIGNNSSTAPGPKNIHVAVDTDGSIIFTCHDGADGADLVTAAALVADEDKVVITVTHSNLTGKSIRLNGVEVGRAVSFKANLLCTQNATARLGHSFFTYTGGPGDSFGDKKLAWISGYSKEASVSEIEQMEAFLAATFGITGTFGPPGPKPSIANPEVEFDIRTLTLADGATIASWPDQSGNSNDATGVITPEYQKTNWIEGTKDIRIEVPSDHFTYDGSGFIGTEFTIFIVARVLSLATTVGFMGGSSFTDLQNLGIFSNAAGAITFTLSTDEGIHAITTVDGIVKADASCFVLTCRHSNTLGKTIRFNKVQVGNSTEDLNDLTGYVNPRLANYAGFIGTDVKFKWISAYTQALTDVQMDAFEEYLLCTFCNELAATNQPWTERVVVDPT